MTKILTLAAKKREVSRQSNRSLEAERRVLGVVYGHGFDPVPVSVDASDILRAYRKVGNSSLVELDIEGKKATVLLKEVNLHPVRHEINHVDFFVVNMKEKATIHVDLVFVGESEAVKTFGGIFVATHKSLDIRCLPADSPRNIEVDKSLLKEIGDHVSIKDLNLDPKKYEVVGLNEKEVVCLVNAQRAAEEEILEVAEEGAEGESEEKTEE